MKIVLSGEVIYIQAGLLIWLLHWKLHTRERCVTNIILIHGVSVIKKVA